MSQNLSELFPIVLIERRKHVSLREIPRSQVAMNQAIRDETFGVNPQQGLSTLNMPGKKRPVALIIASGAFLSSYVVFALKAATTKPLWMDEVLSVWASRFGSPSEINQALMSGAQSSPPVYSVLLHYCAKIGGSNLIFRLPSIFAVIFTAILSFVLLKRYLGAAPSVFASCLIMETLGPFGLQARPYALVTACFVAALLLWDDFDVRPSLWRVVLIPLLLAIAVSLHFYAVLFVPCFGLIELLRTRQKREFRLPLWIGLVLAGGSIFLWFPVMRATSHFTVEDVVASHAYGPTPTIPSLISIYSYLFQGWGNIHLLGGLGINGVIILSAVGLTALGSVHNSFLGTHSAASPEGAAKAKSLGQGESKFWLLVLASMILPFIVFVFSLIVTKTFNLRYGIAGSLGAAAILAEVLNGFPSFRRTVPSVLVIAAILTLIFGVPSIELFDHGPLYNVFPGTYPIVIADGSQFFQLQESSPVDFRSRLVYLALPPDVERGDATNEHAVMRWKKINSALPVEDVTAFLGKHKCFYVLDERTADDTPAQYLSRMRLTDRWAEINGAVIFKSHSCSSSDAWRDQGEWSPTVNSPAKSH